MKKITAIILSTVLAAAMFSGCTSGNKQTENTGNAQATVSTDGSTSKRKKGEKTLNEKILKKRKAKDFAIRSLMYLATGIILLLLLLLIGYIFFRGIPHISLDFLASKPSLINDTTGILPNILNTLYIIAMTVIIALPLGVCSAVYLNEYARNKKVVGIIELATETLAGIPSIIYGLVGMLIFVQFSPLGTSLAAGSLTLSGEDAEVFGSKQIIDEMIYNLLDNAIKYNRENGSAGITIKKESGGITLSVEDTGIGIPYDKQNRVFERFYRVDKSRSKSEGGTGLGLSIVKHGAAYHNAELRLDSVPDKGTTIKITFKDNKKI